jgi:hypothetical protein
MLFNLINLPNLMGARRSCGQYKERKFESVSLPITKTDHQPPNKQHE